MMPITSGGPMPVIDLYSKRRKRELGLEPDVYTYDDLMPTSVLRYAM